MPSQLVFVDVSASQAVPEPPKDAKYYSDKNSIAANKTADKVTDVPKIDGSQTRVVKNADVPVEKFVPLQPSPPSPAKEPPKQPSPPKPPQEKPKPTPPPEKSQPKVAQPETTPRPTQPPGDLAMAKPSPPPAPVEEKPVEQPKPRRPRTVEEALAQQGTRDQLPGQKMKQDGGVKRQALDPGFDVAASPFGAYDRALIEAISQRWYSLLDARDYASDSQGKVVLQFRLHYDGRITDVSIAENTAGEMLGLICQKAIMDPAPFAVWPSDMRRMLGDTRNIQFTFYYN
jgi:outer membrane biosynthesis protein TonB